MSNYTALAYLGFRGEFDALEMSNRVTLEPCSRMQKHHLDEERKIPKLSTLRYGQVESFEAVPDVYRLVDVVVERLSDHRQQLLQIAADPQCEVILQVVVYFPVSEEISTPILGFSREALAFAHEMKASIDIDTYRS